MAKPLALILTASAAVAAVVACPGPLPEDEFFPSPGELDAGVEGGVVDGDTLEVTTAWRWLHRVEGGYGDTGSFWAASPGDYSFLTGAHEKRPDSREWDGTIFELRVKDGQRTFREIFRYNSVTFPIPWHLPDGTAFISNFQNLARDYKRTFWLDLDRTPHFVLNCMQGFDASHPYVLPDGRVRTVMTLYPCHGIRIGPEEKHCFELQVLTRPGTAPEFQCLFPSAHTPLAATWFHGPDGRSIHGVGQHRSAFVDMYFGEDGGFESGKLTATRPYSELQVWPPVHLPDAGWAFVTSTSSADENKIQRWDVHLMTRAPEGHPRSTDAGLLFEILPHLNWRDAPVSGSMMSVQPPLLHRGAWIWRMKRQVHLLNPYSLEHRVFEPAPTPTETGDARASSNLRFYSIGDTLYLLENVRVGTLKKGAFQEFWVRIMDDQEDFFLRTEEMRREAEGR